MYLLQGRNGCGIGKDGISVHRLHDRFPFRPRLYFNFIPVPFPYDSKNS
jgi:hypothetical protein